MRTCPPNIAPGERRTGKAAEGGAGCDALAGGAFNGTAGQVISIALGGNAYRVEGDIDGNSSADFAILVTSPIAIDAGSFIL